MALSLQLVEQHLADGLGNECPAAYDMHARLAYVHACMKALPYYNKQLCLKQRHQICKHRAGRTLLAMSQKGQVLFEKTTHLPSTDQLQRSGLKSCKARAHCSE